MVEALAVKDGRIRELENTCTELKQTIARQTELISELERRLEVQSGPNLTGLVLDITPHQLIPVKRLVEIFGDLFGVKVLTGTVVNMVSRRAIAYGGIVDTIRTGVVQARGLVVHACWKSSFAMLNVAGHGLCFAHILRELEGLFQCGREKWVRKLAELLSRAVHERNLARGRPLSPATMRAIADSYDRIVVEGFPVPRIIVAVAIEWPAGKDEAAQGIQSAAAPEGTS